jgi:micrococcal nuclease
MKRLLAAISPVIILLLILSPGITNAKNKPAVLSETSYYCSYVIDGDTIIVIIDGKKEKVRLIGVDAPETGGPYTKKEPFGREASAFTKKMTEGGNVKLEYDWQKRDKFGRLLAYVYLEDGTFLNAELIKQGYGTVFRKFSFKYRDDFIRYELEARENKRGLWRNKIRLF